MVPSTPTAIVDLVFPDVDGHPMELSHDTDIVLECVTAAAQLSPPTSDKSFLWKLSVHCLFKLSPVSQGLSDLC